MKDYDLIVIGGGAAGLWCAGIAGQRGKRVLVVEHQATVGKKILISGGGRCNFTNVGASAANYLSANPHFAKSALSRYTPADFLAKVEEHRIAWHEKTLGQLFCDGKSSQIVTMCLDECERGGVTFALGQGAEVEPRDGGFELALQSGRVRGDRLVLATGGLSIPKLGASDYAYRTAKRFGLKLIEPRPALVPLTLPPDEALFRALSGVSTDVLAKSGKAQFREAALFTHRGLSGPAILQASSYWRHGETVSIDFLPDEREGWLCEAKRSTPRTRLPRLLGERLPDRLAATLAERIGVTSELANASDKVLREAETKLADWRFTPNGSEGFAKAEVTVGGVSTAELSSQTMESRRVPGLYLIGEAVDVTGWLGGYNFQWAWASAHAAATAD